MPMTFPPSPSIVLRRHAWLSARAPACVRAVVAGAWLGAAGALAATPSPATGTMDVSTSIPVSCTVAALTHMAFSTAIVSTTAQSHDAEGSFRVNCTNAGLYGISIPVSANGGSATQRRMHSSASGGHLRYDVFASAAARRAVGPLYPTAASSTGQVGDGTDHDVVLYGRIPVQAAPATGTYTDTLTVTVAY
jgi:spore coat protein U-like protein